MKSCPHFSRWKTQESTESTSSKWTLQIVPWPHMSHQPPGIIQNSGGRTPIKSHSLTLQKDPGMLRDSFKVIWLVESPGLPTPIPTPVGKRKKGANSLDSIAHLVSGCYLMAGHTLKCWVSFLFPKKHSPPIGFQGFSEKLGHQARGYTRMSSFQLSVCTT